MSNFEKLTDARLNEISDLILNNREYIKATREANKAYEPLKKLIGDNKDLWAIVDEYASAINYKDAIESKLFYDAGVEDGKKSVREALGVVVI